jgi:uncharacterized delta-60 repeat protein
MKYHLRGFQNPQEARMNQNWLRKNDRMGVSVQKLMLTGIGALAVLLGSCAQNPVQTPAITDAMQNEYLEPVDLTTINSQAAPISGQILLTKTSPLPAGSSSTFSQMVIQSNLRTVVANVNGNGGLIVSRFLPNGRPDLGFGTNGSVSFDVQTGNEFPFDVTTDNDGKILIVGVSNQGVSGFDAFVVRITSRGTLDTGFAQNGAFIRRATPTAGYIDPNGTRDSRALKVRTSGEKIVVLGSVADGPNAQPFVWRLTNRGRLDTSFAGDGEAVLDPTGIPTSSLNGMDVRSNGKVVFAGLAFPSNEQSPNGESTTPLYVIQLGQNGLLDTQFGMAGVSKVLVASNEFYSFPFPNGLVIQDNGSTLVATAGSSGYQLFRFNQRGTLERTNRIFGASVFRSPRVLKPLPNGGALITGFEETSAFVTRAKNDLSLDTSFADGGFFRSFFNSQYIAVNDIALVGNTYALALGGSRFDTGAEDFVFSLIAR